MYAWSLPDEARLIEMLNKQQAAENGAGGAGERETMNGDGDEM